MRRNLSLTLACVLLLTSFVAAQEKAKLPDGAALRIGKHRLRVAGSITDYAFTLDKRTLVVAYDEQDRNKPNVVLFDVATGLERKRLPIRGAQHLSLARHKPLMAVDTYQGVELWDVATEKRVQQWDFPECVDEATALTIEPDGSQVIAATSGLLLRWNADTGAALPTSRPRSAEFPIQMLQFSPDGTKLLTAESYGRSGQARQYFGGSYRRGELQESWEIMNRTWMPISALAGPRARLLHHTVWTVGSHWILPPELPLATVWDATTGKKLLEFGDEGGNCVFSPDGTLVALNRSGSYTTVGRFQGRIDFIRLERGWPLVGTIDRPGSVVFSPDSKQVVVGGTLLWDIAGKKTVRELESSYANSTRFSQDGKLLAMVGADEDVRNSRYGSLRFDTDVDTAFSPYYGSGSQNLYDHLQLVDVGTGKPRTYADGYADAVGGLAYSPDGRWLASFSRDTLYIHDAKTGAEQRRWIAHKSNIRQIVFSPDGQTLASTSLDNTIGLWDLANGKERRRLVYGNESEQSIAFARDGKTLISLSQSGQVRRWDLTTGKHIESSQRVEMISPALSPTGEHIAYFETDRDTALVHMRWQNVRTGKNMAPTDPRHNLGPRTGSESLAFSADGKLLAVSANFSTDAAVFLGGEIAVRVWETATQREITRYVTDRGPTGLLAISPDGRALAHGSSMFRQQRELAPLVAYPQNYVLDNAVILRDLASRQISNNDVDKTLRPISGHLGRVSCLAFSPDGKFLATGGSDQVVYVWRVEHFFKRPVLPELKGNVADLWPTLGDADPGRAYRAIAQLEARPKETLALLRKQLRPASAVDEKVITQHVRDLASGNFAIRAQANAALEKLGAEAANQLRVAVKSPANLEMKRRLETLLDKLDRPFDVADNIRAYRCLTLLERIGTPEARQHLEDLAQGAPAAWLTTEAKHSLQRVSK